MAPKARDLQEPGQHDMIEALRDALRQDNSEELNPRMREALKGFRENLQFHPYVRWLEKRATMARTAGSQLFASTRVRVVAGLLAIAGISIAGVLLITARPPNVFAAVLEAMEQVKTAHIVSSRGETWFSRDHGIHHEHDITEQLRQIQVSTPEATWTCVGNKVVISDSNPDAVNELLMVLSGATWLDDDGTASLFSLPPNRRQLSDVLLDGAPAKRVDIDIEGVGWSGTLWIDTNTLRVLAWEEEYLDGERVAEDRHRIEYDMPLDPALFTFEIPKGATIEDRRGAAEPQEGSQ